MTDEKLCEWLLACADTPIRCRVLRELLCDEKAAEKLEPELFQNPVVALWLKNLRPQNPQHRSMAHGSFDFCLENALLKLVRLGLHCGQKPMVEALRFYTLKSDGEASGGQEFLAIITANLLSAAGTDDEFCHRFMLDRLDRMCEFAKAANFDIYLDEAGREMLKGVPAIWRNSEHFIAPDILRKYGYSLPFVYDIVGVYTLYALNNPEIDKKIDFLISLIATDEFHRKIADGYGILVGDGKKYHHMGWDPLFPGWFGAAKFMESGNPSKLLFFAENVANYPSAVKTRWFSGLIDYLETYRTPRGTYLFPTSWLREERGYAVLGHHLSFGENRRKRGWSEIESTFFMLLLKRAAKV